MNINIQREIIRLECRIQDMRNVNSHVIATRIGATGSDDESREWQRQIKEKIEQEIRKISILEEYAQEI